MIVIRFPRFKTHVRKIWFRFNFKNITNGTRLCSDDKNVQDGYLASKFSKQLLSDSRLYKGLAFTPEERELFHLRGVLPPAVIPLEKQLAQFSDILDDTGDTSLTKYIHLMTLYDLNKKLFFKFVELNIERVLRILYAPFIAAVCIDFNLVFSRPSCLYITINDRGIVREILQNWPHKDVRLIVVSDGEKVFGMGDLGINVAPVCVGKQVLLTTIAGLNPHSCLPVVIDVGTDNDTNLNERLYNGLRQKRVRGEPYTQLMDEFMSSAQEVFGPKIVVHMESIGRPNAFRLLQRYKNKYCCFNNDIQSIAAIIVAGLLNAAKIVKKHISELKFVFFGAGKCNLGIGRLLKLTLTKCGISEEEALKNMYFMDKNGLITRNRKLNNHDTKLPFARDLEPLYDLLSIIKTYKPDVLIGASTIMGAFNKDVLITMAQQVEQPIIFALSNPLQKSECTAKDAIKYTDGRCIFASGFPFEPVKYKGKIYYTAQANTYYINAMGMAANLVGIRTITDEMFLRAACALAECVTKENLDDNLIYPPLSKIREVGAHIIVALMEYAYDNNLATVLPEPEDKQQYYQSHIYQADYPDINFYKEMFEKAKPKGN